MTRISRAVLVLALVLVGLAEARAQQTADQPPPAPPSATLLPGIEVLATPYLFFPWISTRHSPRGHKAS